MKLTFLCFLENEKVLLFYLNINSLIAFSGLFLIYLDKIS